MKSVKSWPKRKAAEAFRLRVWVMTIKAMVMNMFIVMPASSLGGKFVDCNKHVNICQGVHAAHDRVRFVCHGIAPCSIDAAFDHRPVSLKL